MIKTDICKITCYNCGITIGVIQLDKLINSSNESQKGITKILASDLNGKFYCIQCFLNKVNKE